MTKIVPSTTDKEEDLDEADHSSSEDESQHETKIKERNPPSSIKCLLIVLVVVAVVSTVILLTTIWISCFSSSVSSLSVSLMSEQFTKIISFTDATIKDVIMVSENAKNTMWWDLKYESTDWINRTTYRIFKSSYQFLSTLMIDAYIGDPNGGNKGIMIMNGIPSILLVNSTGQYWTYCENITLYEYCNTKSSEPNVQLPPFDMSYILGVAAEHVNRPTFTLSYTDPTLPSITFMSLVNSRPATNASATGFNFDWYFGFDISVASISSYLKEITQKITGSFAFVIEIETEYIVASSYPEIPVAKWDKDGNQERKKATNFGVMEVEKVASFLYQRYESKLDSLTCGTFEFLSFNDRYINVYRMCNTANVNWLFVFSVPQWNYIGTMIIAIVIALASSILIVVVGVLLGVFSSFKIVKPFHNLIELFASVSNMDLDNIVILPSSFREVHQLQQHFKTMVAKIKQYRCFIPPHLLAQIDAEGAGEENHDDGKVTIKRKDHNSTQSSLKSGKSSILSGLSRNGNAISNQHSTSAGSSFRPVSKSLFRLGLDKKKITVANFYFVGLDECMENLSDSELVTVMSDYFDAIQKVARLTLGQLGSFEDNSMTVSWNSTSDVSNHEEKGIAASHQILFKLEQVKEAKWKKKEHLVKRDLLQHINFTGSIITQVCRCGNLGTQEIKTFSIVGSYIHNLHKIMRHGLKVNAKLVASEDTVNKSNNIHQMRLVGRKSVLSPEVSSPDFFPNSPTPHKRKIKLFEVGDSNQVSDDEWMYELQQQQSKEKWKLYHHACQFMEEEKYEDAVNCFETYLSNYRASNNDEEDMSACYMIKKCYKLISNASKI